MREKQRSPLRGQHAVSRMPPATNERLGGGSLAVCIKMFKDQSCAKEIGERSSAIRSDTIATDEMPPVGSNRKNAAHRGLLERLDSGEIIIGDGGFVFALEKRGYVKAGPWTPEATVEHPEAVKQLHREFLRAGSTVLQTFTFYASEDKLMNRGNYVEEKITCSKVNEAACDIAREVANEGDALVAGGVSQTPSYLSNKSETDVKAIFRKQLDVFVKKNVDFLIAEFQL